MTKPLMLAIAIAASLMLARASFAEEGKGGGSSEAATPLAPPQPRIVEPFKKQSLPARAADPSWRLYHEGIELYAEKRLGESLVALKKAIETRSELFAGCAADLDSAMESKEAKKAKDSLPDLMRMLAARDLIPQDCEAIRAKAQGSIVAEMRLLRETSPSSPLRGLIDAALLVVEERGMARVGDSLSALRREVGYLGSYPEAEFAIGRTYLAEGELRLAELQFRRACDMKESLELPDDRFGMLEALAGVQKTKSDLKSYELTLREIADASDLFTSKDEYYRGSMERTLGERGFDKFMSMYKVEQAFPVKSFSSLGELYLKDGRRIAVVYLAAAVNATLTRAIAETRIDEPGYAFSSLSELLSRILADRDMSVFATDMNLWKDLKLLGDALSASGYRETAREIWTAMRSVGAPQPWKARAADALSRPFSASKNP
jgi:hypothetical protein